MKEYPICEVCKQPIIGGKVLVDERIKDKYAHSFCLHQKTVPMFGTLLRKLLK